MADDAGIMNLALLRQVRACIRAAQEAGATRDGAGRFILEQLDRHAGANPDDDWRYLRTLIERAIDEIAAIEAKGKSAISDRQPMTAEQGERMIKAIEAITAKPKQAPPAKPIMAAPAAMRR